MPAITDIHANNLRRNRFGDGPGVSLIGVGVTCQQRMWRDAGGGAGLVDLLQHFGAAAVASLTENRVMRGDHEGPIVTGVFRFFEIGERGLQPCELFFVSFCAGKVARTFRDI